MQIKTPSQALKFLWEKGFFSDERKFNEIKIAVGKLGCGPTDENLHMSLKSVKFLTRYGKKGNFLYRQRHSPPNFVITDEVFPEELIKTLGKDFETEINDLNLNFGRSGTCTAFLLRKILEKLIFLTFAKNGMEKQLLDGSGGYVGLGTMLNLATANKVSGKPFLLPKTAKEISGIKFLGDTSAHNPLTNVDMKTIIPQMPFIITAYKELATKL